MRDLLPALRRRTVLGAAMATVLLSATIAAGCGGEDPEGDSQATGGSDQADRNSSPHRSPSPDHRRI
jgi:hypothetical protein